MNVRRVDDKGREERTVVLDEERAPLIKMVFEEYATGEWSLNSLAEYMTARGLTTRATPKIPSSAPTKTIIEKILKNPYYAGIVTYNGVEYAGNHEAIIDKDTFNKVQAVLSARINGERNREHPHLLKGSLFCRSCGSKMLVTYAKSKSGNIYPYFICAGRHNKKKSQKDCTLKAILIEEVERQIEQIYDNYSFDPSIREKLEEIVQEKLDIEKEKFKVELDRLTREKEKIERRQEKLLEAHFNDAIPITLLKK